jgi:DUF4097 and DUF4098 domain-containing protein YvlB
MSNQKKNVQNVIKRPNRRVPILLLITCLFGVTMLGAGCASSEGNSYRKTFSVVPGTVVKIYNKNGNIDVNSWDNDYVEVEAIKQSSFFTSFLKEPSIDVSTGNELIVRTLYSTFLAESIPVQYRITVPKGVLVTHLETSNGKINVDGVSGDVDAQTSKGEIQIHKVNGFVKAVTSNGNIDITGVGGLYEARNDRGDVSVEVSAIRDNLVIKSSNGNITVSFAPDISGQLETSTSNGNITYTDLPLTVNELSKTRLTGKLGEGSSTINVETSRGFITLKKLL